jgi:hypothetical protein
VEVWRVPQDEAKRHLENSIAAALFALCLIDVQACTLRITLKIVSRGYEMTSAILEDYLPGGALHRTSGIYGRQMNASFPIR